MGQGYGVGGITPLPPLPQSQSCQMRHILGNNANTGREIEQSQEVESKYVPEEGKAHFSLPWQRESLSGEEEEKRLTHL